MIVLVLIWLMHCGHAARSYYNFSLTTGVESRYRTTHPVWFRIKGNMYSYSEWFNVSEFPDADTSYTWQQQLNDVGYPVEITVLSFSSDIFGFTFIGVNNQSFNPMDTISIDSFSRMCIYSSTYQSTAK